MEGTRVCGDPTSVLGLVLWVIEGVVGDDSGVDAESAGGLSTAI